MEINNKDYLGDSVYAEFTGDAVVLTTENGMGASNTIVLDNDTVNALKNFIKRIEEHKP